MSKFWKYAGTGNDFVVVDNRTGEFTNLTAKDWKTLCQRKTGIGADGALLLSLSDQADFRMTYLNADGGEVEMCGNGGRCISAFAKEQLGLIPKQGNEFVFATKEGLYRSQVKNGSVDLLMTELNEINTIEIASLYPESLNAFYMKAGVPHCVYQVKNIDTVDLVRLAPPIRHAPRFPQGTNVNLIEVLTDNRIKIRTFERGVEDETLSCGTGATAAALACHRLFGWQNQIQVSSKGGELTIKLEGFTATKLGLVYLSGAVRKVFTGEFDFSSL